jgi:hypothetical protein
MQFDGNTQWVHVFRNMVESGDVARMGAITFAVYVVIKCYVNFTTGQAFPSVEEIARKSGISKRQTINSLKILEDMGYLTRRREWRKNIYTLREKVLFEAKDGRPVAVATWDYLPLTVKAARAELANFKLTGDDKAPTLIHIDKLVIENINVIQGDQVNVTLPEDKEMRDHLLSIKQKLKPRA